MMVDVICFSHLRWNFVYQRPQHLLSRYAKTNRVFFIEEPVFDARNDHYQISNEGNICVVVFHLQKNSEEKNVTERQRILLSYLMEDMELGEYILWYYSPLALSFSHHLKPRLIIYDCMDELSAFKNAPPSLKQKENELLECANIVFTGGHSLYEAKKDKHPFVYAFPSSIDKDHFLKARKNCPIPEDQKSIPHPQLGFYGVIDERFDITLLAELAHRQPHWHFIIIGPFAKIAPESLPQTANIHYLGAKSYNELPQYLSGWDIAIMPFALNESTKYISPTKTPEYLAGGKPVISTSIKDVVEPYGNNAYVYIADTADEFIAAAGKALKDKDDKLWLQRVDAYLENISWDKTWSAMLQIIEKALRKNFTTKKQKINEYV